MVDVMDAADVVRAPGCPHYITRQRLARMLRALRDLGLPEDDLGGRLRCHGCMLRPITT